MNYIIVNMTARIPVRDLSHYEAESIDQAADNQAQWFEDGCISLDELVDGGDHSFIESITFTGVTE